MSPPAEVAEWYHLAGLDLHNKPDGWNKDGDNVAIVERWSPPDRFNGITKEHAATSRRVIGERADTGVAFRVEQKSQDWVGKEIGEICGFDAKTDEGAARAKSIVSTWVKNGVLEEFKGKDKDRHARSCIRPGPGQ
jgi:hypothetical protein